MIRKMRAIFTSIEDWLIFMKVLTTEVFRVQSALDEKGPYCWSYDSIIGYSGVRDGMSFINSTDHLHPSSRKDPLLKPFFSGASVGEWLACEFVGAYFLHGFRSMDACLEWFHSCSLDALLSSGFEVVRYVLPVNRVLHGTYQSIFHSSAWVEKEVFIPSTASQYME